MVGSDKFQTEIAAMLAHRGIGAVNVISSRQANIQVL